jgi:phenylalanyl-tRNA synthetase beta chain
MSVDQFLFVEKISADELQPGDLIFANTLVKKNKIDYASIEFLKGTKIEHGVDHVGIYIGENKIIHATEYNNLGVVEEDLKQSVSFKNIVGYGRLPKSNENRFAVTVPMERLDIKNSPDLIEELGRIIGYERVVDQKIELTDFTAKSNPSYQLSVWLKNTLMDFGFSEIITYAFVSEGTLEPLKPIAEDKAFVRNTLLLGMKSAFDRNINNADLLGLDHIKLFEIGKVFEKQKGDNSELHQKNFPESKYQISEKLMLSIGVNNKLGIKKPKPTDLIKEIIQKIETDLNIKIAVKINDQTDMLEICLDDLIADKNVTSFLNQNFANKNPKLSEIDANVKFKPFSAYPFMLRDIAVWVPSVTEKNEVAKLITEMSGDLLVNTKLFDVYEKENRTSYAYRLVFQSFEKTLTDEDANIIMKKITDLMIERGWEVR